MEACILRKVIIFWGETWKPFYFFTIFQYSPPTNTIISTPATLCSLNYFSLLLLWPTKLFSCLLNSPRKLGSTKFSTIYYTSRSITLRQFPQINSSSVHQGWPDQGWFGTTQFRYHVHDWKQRLQIKTGNWGEMKCFSKNYQNQSTSPRERWCTWTTRVYSSKYTAFGTVKAKGLL